MGLVVLNLLFPLEGPNVVYIYEPELNTLETLNYVYMLSFFLLFFFNKVEYDKLNECSSRISYTTQSTQTIEITALNCNATIIDCDTIINWVMLLT